MGTNYQGKSRSLEFCVINIVSMEKHEQGLESFRPTGTKLFFLYILSNNLVVQTLNVEWREAGSYELSYTI